MDDPMENSSKNQTKTSKVSKVLERISRNADGENKEFLDSLRNCGMMGMSFKEKLRYVLSNVTVEPIMLLMDLAHETSGSIPEFLFLEKICRTDYNYTDEMCHSILYSDSHQHLNEQIHRSMADWQIILSVMHGVPAIIVTLIMTSWSDKHGKRFPIIAPMFTMILYYFLMIGNVYFVNAPVYMLVVSRIPIILFGTFFTHPIILAYITEVSTEKNRSARLMILNLVAIISIIISSAIGGQIYKYAGFYAVFGTSIALYTVAISYGIIFLPELPRNIKLQEKQNCTWKTRLKDIFSIKNFFGGLKTVFKPRPNGARTHIIVFLLIWQIFEQSHAGMQDVSFLFQQLMFNWNATDTANYTSIVFTIRAVVLFAAFLLLLFIFRGKDNILGIVGCSVTMLGLVVLGFSKQVWMYYLGRFFVSWDEYTFPAMLSVISSIIPEDEIGKLLGVSESLYRIINLGTTPAYQALYKATLNIFPGTIFIVTAILSVFILVYFIFFLAFPIQITNVNSEHLSNGGSNSVTSNNHDSPASDEEIEVKKTLCPQTNNQVEIA